MMIKPELCYKFLILVLQRQPFMMLFLVFI